MARINTKILSFGDVQKSLQEIEKELNLLSESVNSPAETNIEDSQGKTGDVKIIKNPDKTYTFKVRSAEGWQSPIFDHDSMTNFVANEHIDWTTDQGSTNIHTGNYVAGGTSEFTLTADSGSDQTISNTNTLTIEGGEGIDTVVGATDKVTVSGVDASTSNKGIAIFSSNNFAVSSGTVTIKDEGVALAELAHIATDSFLGRTTSSTGDVEVLSKSDALAILNVADGATANAGTVTSVGGTGTVNGLTLTGTVTSSGNLTLGGTLTINNGDWSGTALADGNIASASTWNSLVSNATHTGDVTGATSLTIADDAVTYAKMQNMSDNRVLGRYDEGDSGVVTELNASTLKAMLTITNVENTSLSTWAGTTNITTLGTIATGTWNGTAIGDSYISSASTWNAKQDALTFGISNTNAVKIDAADVADDDYARFTANGLEGRTLAEIKTDIGTDNSSSSALVPSAGTSGHFLKHDGTFGQVAYSNLSGTPTIPNNFLRDDADDTTSGTITAAGFTTTGTWTFDDATSGTVGITTVHTGSSFTDNDTSLMTAGAIKEKIEAYGYTTADGDITSVRFVTDSGSGAAAEDTADTANFSLLGSSGVGITNSGTTITAVAVPGEIDHDSLNNFAANEHIDWTSASAGTIDASNYTNTTYSVMASGNSYAAGLVAAGSGTHSNQFLRKDGTWVVPENDNTTYTGGTNLTLDGTEFDVDDAFITNDADDTMAGTLTIDKDSTATTSSTTGALLIDYDHTGITASGQTISNIGVNIDMLNNSVTHVGTHKNYGINSTIRSNTTGTSEIYGFYNYTSIADTIYGIYNESTGAGTTGYGIYQKHDDGDTDYIQVSSANTADYFTMSTTANGATTLETVDADAALAHLTLDPDGDLIISGADTKIDATKKLYLDGGTHTSIYEYSDDVLKVDVGGQNMMLLTEVGGSAGTIEFNNCSTGVIIGQGTKLYLDGGSNTYVESPSADSIVMACGSATMLTLQEDGATNGDYASFGTTSAGFTQFEPTYNATDTYVYFNRAGNKANLTFGAASTAIDDIHMHFPPVSGNFTLLIKQHSSGGGSVNNWKTFDKAGSNESTVVWAGGSAPTLTTGANKIDIISVYWDADNNKAYGVASLNF